MDLFFFRFPALIFWGVIFETCFPSVWWLFFKQMYTWVFQVVFKDLAVSFIQNHLPPIFFGHIFERSQIYDLQKPHKKKHPSIFFGGACDHFPQKELEYTCDPPCRASASCKSQYGCFLKWWYPTTMGFPTKNDHFGVFWGYHNFRKHPYGDTSKKKIPSLQRRWASPNFFYPKYC